VEGDAGIFGDLAGVFMVGNDRSDFGVEPADADLIEQMQQRVVEF